jgi:hypothetical protein
MLETVCGFLMVLVIIATMVIGFNKGSWLFIFALALLITTLYIGFRWSSALRLLNYAPVSYLVQIYIAYVATVGIFYGIGYVSSRLF